MLKTKNNSKFPAIVVDRLTVVNSLWERRNEFQFWLFFLWQSLLFFPYLSACCHMFLAKRNHIVYRNSIANIKETPYGSPTSIHKAKEIVAVFRDWNKKESDFCITGEKILDPHDSLNKVIAFQNKLSLLCRKMKNFLWF